MRVQLLQAMIIAASAMVATTFTLNNARSVRRSTAIMAKKMKRKKSGFGQMSDGEEETAASASVWLPVRGLASREDLPTEENQVKLVDTMAQQLMDPRTNPNGAVSVVNYNSKRTYCFSASCSSCKIPLTKAKILDPNEETDNVDPRLECDFCGSTYNLRTGKVLSEDKESRGLLDGLVKGFMSKNNKVPLATYELGDKGGKVMINIS